MAPRFHPSLVNDTFSDPALYIEFMFEKRAILFDLGDLAPLSTRKILRLTDVFISHMHIDHFCGFDRLLRLFLGRQSKLRLYGPAGLIDAVAHKLAAYTWNLVENYDSDFTFIVSELISPERMRTAEFHTRSGFSLAAERHNATADCVLLDEPGFRIRTVQLDHGIPCLAFALEEKAHINIWKNRLDELGYQPGPWLRELKEAILRGDPDDLPFKASWRQDGGIDERTVSLGYLKAEITRTVQGQKIAYVVDTAYSQDNVRHIVALCEGADILYIESPFMHADVERAAQRKHLTARQAGMLAREAGVKRLATFHYSPRYGDDCEQLAREAQAAFTGEELTA